MLMWDVLCRDLDWPSRLDIEGQTCCAPSLEGSLSGWCARMAALLSASRCQTGIQSTPGNSGACCSPRTRGCPASQRNTLGTARRKCFASSVHSQPSRFHWETAHGGQSAKSRHNLEPQPPQNTLESYVLFITVSGIGTHSREAVRPAQLEYLQSAGVSPAAGVAAEEPVQHIR